MLADAYVPNNDFQIRGKRVADDQPDRVFRNTSEIVNSRNKSTKPVKYAESEIKYDKANPFGTNNNPAQMAQLGFGKDFLVYEVNDNQKNKEAELKKLEIVKQNQFENIEDIDFQSNNLANMDGNPFLDGAHSPSFGKFHLKKKDKLPEKLPDNVDFLNW